MSNKLYLSLFGLLLLGTACNRSNPDATRQIVKEIPIREVAPTLIAIDQPEIGSLLHLSSFASSAENITLDTTKYGSPEGVFKIEFSNDGDFILLNTNQAKIYRYDSSGHFLNLIPGDDSMPQLINPVDFAYNPYNQHVFVLDNALNMILEYTLRGDFVRTKTPLPFGAIRIGFVDENHYCFYSNYSSEESASGYNYHVTDTLFNEVGRFEPCTPTKDSRIGFTQIFTYDGKHLIGKSPASNYLYHITADSITPLYQIEINDDENWISEKNADSLLHKRINLKNIDCCERVYFADHYMIVHYFTATDGLIRYPKTIVYDRNTQETLSGDILDNDLPLSEYDYYLSHRDNSLFNFRRANSKQPNATIHVTHLK
ncbi:MAG: 6-bladed beta-propeller [Bacteroidales bacterium]|nr:6-bladed beta-propeller [Bacteroidales bacterium]